jgi:hypothetical protein
MGAVTTLFAIILWSKTRDAAWICVIIGVILSYVEIIFTTFKSLGILHDEFFLLWGVPVLALAQLVLLNAPLVLLVIAFIILISRNRLP